MSCAACSVSACLVGEIGVGLLGGDEARAHIGEVGAERERGRNAPAVGDRARQQDGALEPLLHLAQQRERRQRAGMSAGAGANQDEAVDALFGGLARMLDVDDVMEHDAAIGMRGLDDFLRRPQRGDDDRRLVLDAGLHVLHQPVVGGVADLVDRVGRDLLLRVQRLVFAELVLDAASAIRRASRPGARSAPGTSRRCRPCIGRSRVRGRTR